MAAELTDTLRNAGALLSNCAFNLGQRTPGTILTAEDVSVLKSLARQWDAALATQQAAQGAEPLFFYRPCRDGLYEGPHHANSVGGKMLRDEKPGEWKPLYPSPPPTAEVEKKAARYDWLRNDATHDQQDRWLMRLPEQADEYADKKIAARTQSNDAAGGGEVSHGE